MGQASDTTAFWSFCGFAIKYLVMSSQPMKTFMSVLVTQMHFPLRRTVVSCCPVIILPGNAFLFIRLCFAQPTLDWGLNSVFLHMASKLYCSRPLAPQTAGCWAGHLDGSKRGDLSLSFYYSVSREDPWLGLAHRSNIRLYLMFVCLFVFASKKLCFPQISICSLQSYLFLLLLKFWPIPATS